MNKKTTVLALAISHVLMVASGSVAADDSNLVRGRVIDDSVQAVVAPGHNTEFNTPLEELWGHSDVLTRDVKKMRASAATLPRSQVSKTETLSDADLGALFESGRDELLPGSRAQLDRIAGELADKQHLRFLIVGHADAQRLSPRTRAIFRDNQGLSEARAFQVAQYLRGKLKLPAEAFTIRGEGDRVPVADNSTPEGMAKNRRVEVQVWFDQTQTVATAPVQPTLSSSCYAQDVALPNQPMRISVDGQPVDSTVPSEADHQRCVDVATNQHHIQIQFDPLKTDAALNVWSWPSEVTIGQPVEFHTYSNYVHWIRKAEVRLFAPGQDPREKPMKVLPVKIGSSISWTPDGSIPTDSLFLLRVYDAKGRFDETALKPLTIVDRARPLGDEESPTRERLTGYGENSLRVRNIQVIGGSVTVSGSDVASGDVVTTLGAEVPVDAHGRFVARQLLPAGTHTVEVETRDPDGDFTRYSRNLTIAGDSFFYVALGELTAAKNRTTGPAQLVTQDADTYAHESEVTGRGAFYVKGKIKQDYLITASADTRERPIEDLFSNFTSKDPRFLLERIDAERAYPVYGDDSTSEWDAPTNGRFYARIEHRDSRAMWGNFQSAWNGLELNQFSRSLYGADLLLKSDATTSFGERRFTNDAFAAEPGTLNSREEFRGTGGSLYYLHRQDITRGSERLWVEVRDATSGMTLQRTQLIPGQDYEMSYLQGRVLLRAPLSSVADSSSLVQFGSLSGNPAYLVATYEYTPGLNEVDSNVYGLRNSTWLNDYVRVGVSGYRQGESQDRQTLGGIDATLRYRPATYLDLEFARSDGAAADLTSIDGGFGFNQNSTADVRADASRVQGVFDLSEIWSDARGRGSVYWQDREAGFSGAGALATGQRIEQKGAAFSAPVSERVSVDVKADERDAQVQSVEAQEAALHYQISERWAASIGGRHDDRDNAAANASTLLSQNGTRTDGVVRIDYKPLAKAEPNSTTSAANAALQNNAAGFDVTRSTVPSDAAAESATRPASWQAYSYVQQTLERDGDRDRNDRVGVGLEKQINDRFRLGGELSDGTGGVGGKLTGDYRVNDRSNVYLGHSTETERPDSNYRGRFGNTVLGSRVKLSDQVSVYDEARDARGAGPQSLTNAFGVDLAPNDRWTYGLKFEAGTVSDPLAGDLKRRAAGLGIAYKFDQVKFTSNLEYRHEDGTAGERDTWLGRNTAGYQVTPEWRLVGKFNFSYSDASQGNFYDGDFVDASLGGAFRPTTNDRWNTLIQVRYYYTLPSPGQVNLSDDLLDYAQRSYVFSIDTIYDVLPWLSFGTKFAQRTGELRDTRTGGDWYSSRADLAIFRTDIHFIREWDALVEGRRLTVAEAEDSRTGILAAIYRHLGRHTKLGAGYNFTDFSDDLTDLSYRSRGPFINLMSTF
jgi:outer membrane protein OmpA-like peptidoglycan-associated protein